MANLRLPEPDLAEITTVVVSHGPGEPKNKCFAQFAKLLYDRKKISTIKRPQGDLHVATLDCSAKMGTVTKEMMARKVNLAADFTNYISADNPIPSIEDFEAIMSTLDEDSAHRGLVLPLLPASGWRVVGIADVPKEYHQYIPSMKCLKEQHDFWTDYATTEAEKAQNLLPTNPAAANPNLGQAGGVAGGGRMPPTKSPTTDTEHTFHFDKTMQGPSSQERELHDSRESELGLHSLMHVTTFIVEAVENGAKSVLAHFSASITVDMVHKKVQLVKDAVKKLMAKYTGRTVALSKQNLLGVLIDLGHLFDQGADSICSLAKRDDLEATEFLKTNFSQAIINLQDKVHKNSVLFDQALMDFMKEARDVFWFPFVEKVIEVETSARKSAKVDFDLKRQHVAVATVPMFLNNSVGQKRTFSAFSAGASSAPPASYNNVQSKSLPCKYFVNGQCTKQNAMRSTMDPYTGQPRTNWICPYIHDSKAVTGNEIIFNPVTAQNVTAAKKQNSQAAGFSTVRHLQNSSLPITLPLGLQAPENEPILYTEIDEASLPELAPDLEGVDPSMDMYDLVELNASVWPGLKPWHEGIIVRHAVLDRVDKAPVLFERALENLKLYGTAKEGGIAEVVMHEMLQEIMLPLDEYLPGSPSLFIKTWRQLASYIDDNDELVKKVLGWLESGYKIKFASAAKRKANPNPNASDHDESLKGILGSNKFSPEAINEMLETDEPKPYVHLKNLYSALEESDFVTKELLKLEQLGTIAKWDPAQGQPMHQFPLGVVKKGSKLRLICALNYINHFEQYQLFKYEDLKNVRNLPRPNDYIDTEDAKAGYHLIPIAPECWPYLCCEWKGTVYYYKYLPFGLASACATYTQFMLVVNKLLRQHGEELNQYLDDRLSTARTAEISIFRCITRQMLNAALGIFINKDKCVFPPAQRARYLGLDLITNIEAPDLPDGYSCGFAVPAERIITVKELATTLLEAPVVSPRQEAKFCGYIVSLKEAIPMCRLYLKRLRDQMKERTGWDQQFPLNINAGAELLWWIMHIEQFATGARWIKPVKPDGILMTIDSSESRHAAIVQDLATKTIITELVEFPDDPELVALLVKDSNANETRGITQLIKKLMKDYPVALPHKKLKVQCDSQSSVSNFNEMKAESPNTFCYILEAWEIFLEYDIEAEFVWLPREHPDIVEVDALSKVEDISDVVLTSEAFDRITLHPIPGGWEGEILFGRPTWGDPTLDVFAHNSNNKAGRFYSQWNCTNTWAVNAYDQPWRRDSGLDGLVWCFPGPFTDAALAIRKFREEKCDGILIVPSVTRQPWLGSLLQLPIIDKVEIPYNINGSKSYVKGPAFPKNKFLTQMQLTAYFISWRKSEFKKQLGPFHLAALK